jgi:23S rRNA (adenine2503-C2)-methyltransferase
MRGEARRIEVLSVSGDARVAEVGVLRLGADPGRLVEVVDGLAPPAPRAAKWIVNLSTQFGCPVGCPTCDAAGAYSGEPDEEELWAQVAWALGRHPGLAARCAKLKVHLARMGEPSLNDAVLPFLEALPARLAAPGLWACVASVAPRGREAWFARLREVKRRLYPGRFQLQFSIQSTDPDARAWLVPVACWNLDEIADFGHAFWAPGDRKVLLNFALARGVPFEPEVLLGRFSPERFALKLTPLNPTFRGRTAGLESVLRSPSEGEVRPALERLGAHGFDVVWSVGDGREDEIGSNCGQAVRLTLAERGC